MFDRHHMRRTLVAPIYDIYVGNVRHANIDKLTSIFLGQDRLDVIGLLPRLR